MRNKIFLTIYCALRDDGLILAPPGRRLTNGDELFWTRRARVEAHFRSTMDLPALLSGSRVNVSPIFGRGIPSPIELTSTVVGNEVFRPSLKFDDGRNKGQ